MRDVVVVMVSDTYSDSVRRGFYSTADQTILSLLDSPRIGRVLVVDHPRGILSQVRRRAQGDRPAPSSGRLRGVRPLTVQTPTPLQPAALRRRYRAFDWQIRQATRRFGMRDVAMISFDLFHAAVGSPWAAHQVFYAQDDETAIADSDERVQATSRAYAEIASGSAAVVAVSQPLLARIVPESPGSPDLVIPNGVDAALWQHLPPRSAGTGPDGAGTIVYAGTIDQRLDVGAVGALTAAGYAVRMVGPQADPGVTRTLQLLDGVTLVGPVSRRAVVTELVSADMCLLAHRDTELTRAMSPLKLFEYVASGTPVVATDLGSHPPEVRDLVELVSPGGDYAAAAGVARARGPLDEPARRDFLSRVSWRTRHAPLVDLITA